MPCNKKTFLQSGKEPIFQKTKAIENKRAIVFYTVKKIYIYLIPLCR